LTIKNKFYQEIALLTIFDFGWAE